LNFQKLSYICQNLTVMKIKKCLILALLLLYLISCNSHKSENFLTQVQCGKTVFDYGTETQRAILLNGTINDSIKMRFFFDTGYLRDSIMVSDSLKDIIKENYASVSIGQFKSVQNIKYADNGDFFFKYFDSNTAFVGWHYFKNKIIKISYKEKFIEELHDISDLDNYYSIRIDTAYKSLTIPIEIHIQGKMIQENIIIDTGSNGFVNLSLNDAKKYSINLYNAKRMTGFSLNKKIETSFMAMDSLNAAGYSITDGKEIGFTKSQNKRLLGNQFFENFTIILDLKNFYLYLKPVE